MRDVGSFGVSFAGSRDHSHIEESALNLAARANPVAVLSKPFSRDVLLQALSAAIAISQLD